MKRELKLDVSLRRVYSSTRGHFWLLSVGDAGSSTAVVSAEITDAQFSAMIGGSIEVECPGTVYQSPHLGKIRVAHPTGLFVPEKKDIPEGEIRAYAESFHPGWLYNYGYGNMHRWSRRGGYVCSFIKYVDDDDTEVKEGEG